MMYRLSCRKANCKVIDFTKIIQYTLNTKINTKSLDNIAKFDTINFHYHKISILLAGEHALFISKIIKCKITKIKIVFLSILVN